MDQQKHRDQPARPWSVSVAIEDVPEQGRHVELHADAQTRQALAKLAGVLEVSDLTASFDLTRRGRDGLHVTGAIEATVRQTCVVTLEPLTNTVHESVDLLFEPPIDGGDGIHHPAAAAADEVDPPEPLFGGKVDLGAIATEFLLLGIDPYPRRADARFEAPHGEDAEGAHPFAALRSLKGGRGS
jgi:hypothetical protein